jgi:hypothetical protein
MIGGEDIRGICPDELTLEEYAYILQQISGLWPDALFESMDKDRRGAGCQPLVGFKPTKVLREVLIYRNRDSFSSWRDLGLTPDNANKMVQILVNSDEVTFVVTGPEDSDIRRLTTQLIKTLRNQVPIPAE